MHKVLVLSVLLLFAPLISAQELKLDDAIRLATAGNLDIANARLNVAIAQENWAAARTRLFPSTTLFVLGSQSVIATTSTIKQGQLGTYPGIGPIPARNTDFTTGTSPTGLYIGRIAQPLTGLYKVRIQLKSLSLVREIDQEKLRASQQQTVNTVKQIYYQIQQAESALTATREAMKLAREAERLATEYVAKQAALESDLLQAQTQVAKAEQDELTLSDQIASAKEKLNVLLNRDILAEFTVTPVESLSNFDYDLPDVRRKALAQRSELRQARLGTATAEQQYRFKRAAYIPDLNAEFNTLGLLNYSSLLPANFASVGFSLSWTPLDWGYRRHEANAARLSVDQSKNSELNARNKVLADVDDKYRALTRARAQFKVVNLSRKTATEQLRIANAQFKYEATLLKTVLQNQANLAQANNDYQQSLARLWAAKADLEFAMGEDK